MTDSVVSASRPAGTTLAGPPPSLAAPTVSSQRLRALIDRQPAGQPGRRSLAADWPVTQVLSHLGSATRNGDRRRIRS